MRVYAFSLLLFLGVAATAPDAVAQDSRLRDRLPPPAVAPVEAVVDAARRDGLPTEPLVDRALEGASKRAPADRIVIAVQRLAGELRTARAALGASATAGEIVAGASALRAGATPDDLATLRDMRGAGSLLIPAAVLADLVAVGVPVDTAVAAVVALAGGLDDAQYIAFQRNVERDIGLGASPVTAVGVRLDALAEFVSPTADSPQSPGAPRPRKP